MINIINFLRYLKRSKFGSGLIEILTFFGIYEGLHGWAQNWYITTKRKKIRSSEQDLSPLARKIYHDLKDSIKRYKKDKKAVTIISITEEIAQLSKCQLLEMARCVCANTKLERKPRIFVDISGVVAQNAKYMSGVQRVTISIVKEFFLDPQDKFDIVPVYSAFYESGYLEANKLTRDFFNIKTERTEDEIIDPRFGDIFLGLDLARKETIDKAKYLQQMHSNGVKIYFVVYDLLPIQFPDFWPAMLKNDEMHLQWLQIICQFDGVICISKAVADDLAAWCKQNAIASKQDSKDYQCKRCLRSNPENALKSMDCHDTKSASRNDEVLSTYLPQNGWFAHNDKTVLNIDWFHIGADIASSINSTGLPDNYLQIINMLTAKPTFLSVGTLEPRKGNAQILAAFEVLWQKNYDFNLVFVGKKGWLVKDLIKKINKHQQLNKCLFWLDNVSDEYLEKIYVASTCLIAASYGEGFGLPLIEAARHKIPLMVRDIPVFREVAVDNAFYFTANNEQELADQVIKWFALHSNHQVPSSENMHFLTWQQSATRLFEIITA